MLSGNEVEMICKSRLAALFGRTSPRKTPPAGTPEKGHSGAAPALEWQDDYNLTLNGYRFLLSFDTETLEKGSSEPDRFLLGKPRHMVEWAADIAQTERVRNVFEMGILQGGSVVLYDLLFRPDKIVAIDHAPTPVPALANYISGRGEPAAVRPYYGISQDDRVAMEALLSGEFPARDIDLIVDDASHAYVPTRTAFNICFPYLRPGGLYIIEDWAWAHWAGDFWQGKDSRFADETALSNLLIELFMMSASRPDLIESLFVDHNMVMVKRGAGALPVGEFDIAAHYLLRGKSFGAWL